MFIRPDEPVPGHVDVCIVGGGPAGLTVAATLAQGDRSVLLLESGGLEFDPFFDGLNTIERSDSPYATHSKSRRRQLGGSAHLWNTRLGTRWGARFIRLEHVDLEHRDWLPDGAWPFGLEELESYYARAERLCGVSHEGDEEEAQGAWFRLDDDPVRVYVERFGLARVFTHDLPLALRTADRVLVRTNATVTELITDRDGTRITGVRFVSAGGASAVIEASVVVLAAGGIENARLLLLSRGAHKNGLGNGRDLVGRYFMDHHRLDWGVLRPARRDLFDSAAIFDLVRGRSDFRMGKLTIAPAALRSSRLLGTSIELFPILSDSRRRLVSLTREMVSGNSGRKIKTIAELGRDWKPMLDMAGASIRLGWYQKRFPGTVHWGSWSRLPGNRNRFGEFRLLQIIEQQPLASNRLSLSTTLDSLGQFRIHVENRLSSLDVENVYRTRRVVTDRIDRAGIGSVLAHEGLRLVKPGGIHHHIGGTRMHRSPRCGVTDEHGEVHDVRNLFVVGSSTFPSGGYANPTLTVIALAMRTADVIVSHLMHVPSVAGASH